jgi:hypothetical protein
MTNVQIGRGIVNGGGNIVITLALFTHKKILLKNKKSPMGNPRATKIDAVPP